MWPFLSKNTKNKTVIIMVQMLSGRARQEHLRRRTQPLGQLGCPGMLRRARECVRQKHVEETLSDELQLSHLHGESIYMPHERFPSAC